MIEIELGNVAQIASALLSTAAIVLSITGPRSRASAQAHKELSAEVATLKTDVVAMRSDIEHLPDAAATHRQELLISELTAKVEVLGERLKPVSEATKRIQEWLLDQSKGGR